MMLLFVNSFPWSCQTKSFDLNVLLLGCFAQQCTYLTFLNLFFHVLKGIFIVDLSRQQIEKGKRVFFKSEYNGLKLYFPQTKVILESVLFSSEILTASIQWSSSDMKVQQKEGLRLGKIYGEGVIGFWFPVAQ